MVQIRRIKMIPLMNLDRQYASLQEQLDEAALKVLHSGNYISNVKPSIFVVHKLSTITCGFCG